MPVFPVTMLTPSLGSGVCLLTWPLGSRPSGQRRGAGSFFCVCTSPGTAGFREWRLGRHEQMDQKYADTEPSQRLQVRFASARSLVLTLTVASPGRWCEEDGVMVIVGSMTGTLVCHTLARHLALCLLFSHAVSFDAPRSLHGGNVSSSFTDEELEAQGG